MARELLRKINSIRETVQEYTADLISNRLRFDIAQTLTALQKVQGRINLGVADVDLDARYAKLIGALDVTIRRIVNPRLVIQALDTSNAYVSLINTVGRYDIALTPNGDLNFNNYTSAGVYQNTPIQLFNDGTLGFNLRPTFGGVGLATLAEVGGGTGVAGVSSFKGRTGPVDPASGDYGSAQIIHGAGTVASALAALDFDTISGGTY